MNLPNSTKAAVLYRLNEPLVLETLEIPALQAGQVLVKVAYAGVCYTQLLEVRGRKGEDKFLPHTLGHEASGKVLAVGDGVSRVKANDHVVLSWIKGPGQNAPAPKYRNEQGQTVNAGQVATFTQYAVVSENRCTPITEKLPLKTAALLGCAVPTGAGIVMNQIKARPGQSIAVFGAGGIGLSATLAAKLMHCSPIIAVDVSDEKLSFAKELGATHTVNVRTQDTVKAILAIAKSGVDHAIEASGQKSAMEDGYKIVRDNGGQLIIAGNLNHGEKISIDPFDFIKGKNIFGTAGGQTQPERDLPLFAELNLAGQMKFERLTNRELKLEQINQAFDELERGVLGRILIDLS